MRTLVVGAGVMGGFFGGGLRHVGQDVTFLVRPARAEQLRRSGLSIISPNGNFTTDAPCIVAGGIAAPYDVILLGVKSYALAAAMEDFAPAVGPATMIIPTINGMAHLQTLGDRFGAEHVLGGVALTNAAMDADGAIRQMAGNELIFGEQAGGLSPRVRALAEAWAGTPYLARASEEVLRDMWEKWALIGTAAGMTCLMRASFGDILAAPGGRDTMLRSFAECCAVATAAGYPPHPGFIDVTSGMFTTEGSPVKASMLRDIERGAPTEGAHVLGGLAREARRLGVATPILDLACVHLGAYEAARTREAGG